MDTPLSLFERLRQQPSDSRWKELCNLYEPLIRRYLQCDPTLRDEADDLVQEVLSTVARELARFNRRRDGSFRHWLRTVTMNRLRAFWRERQHWPAPLPAGWTTTTSSRHWTPTRWTAC